MNEDRAGLLITAAFLVAFFAVVAACKWYGATQEAAAFNRCNPGANVTTLEALWAEYRITDCRVKP